MYENHVVNISDEWIANYAAKQGVSIEAVLAAIAAYDSDFRTVMGNVTNYCDGKTEAPYIFDYLPKRVTDGMPIKIFDPKVEQKKVDDREYRRLASIRKDHDEIRRRMAAGTM